MSKSKKIYLEYFASLKEIRKCKSETLETNAETALDLFNELNFNIAHNNIKVAINEEFQNWETLLKDNDTVVFMLPVAGG